MIILVQALASLGKEATLRQTSRTVSGSSTQRCPHGERTTPRQVASQNPCGLWALCVGELAWIVPSIPILNLTNQLISGFNALPTDVWRTKSQPVLRSSFAVSAMHHKMAGLPGALILGYRNPYRNSRTNPIRKFTNSSCQRINVLGQENTKCRWMLTMKPRNMLGSDQQKCPPKKPWSIRDSGDFPHDHCIKMVGSGVTSSNKQDNPLGTAQNLVQLATGHLKFRWRLQDALVTWSTAWFQFLNDLNIYTVETCWN